MGCIAKNGETIREQLEDMGVDPDDPTGELQEGFSN